MKTLQQKAMGIKITLSRILFAVWVILWLVFFIRENKKGDYKQFFDLAGKSLEEKRAYLLGDDLYRFVRFCSGKVPGGARYKIAGVTNQAVEYVRAIYYLCPLKAVDKGYDYIFVFNSPGFSEENFEKEFTLDENSFILKKAR